MIALHFVDIRIQELTCKFMSTYVYTILRDDKRRWHSNSNYYTCAMVNRYIAEKKPNTPFTMRNIQFLCNVRFELYFNAKVHIL